MTESTRSTRETSLDAVYDVLRRVPYEQACAEYTMACIYLRSDAHRFELAAVADPVLKPLGWTTEDMMTEAIRRAKEENERNVIHRD
jgi:hypothetical protein